MSPPWNTIPLCSILFPLTDKEVLTISNLLIDLLLHPIFILLVLTALIAAIIGLVILRKQQRQASGLRGILIVVIALCTPYLLSLTGLVFLFDSAPTAPPVPYSP